MSPTVPYFYGTVSVRYGTVREGTVPYGIKDLKLRRVRYRYRYGNGTVPVPESTIYYATKYGRPPTYEIIYFLIAEHAGIYFATSATSGIVKIN